MAWHGVAGTAAVHTGYMGYLLLGAVEVLETRRKHPSHPSDPAAVYGVPRQHSIPSLLFGHSSKEWFFPGSGKRVSRL